MNQQPVYRNRLQRHLVFTELLRADDQPLRSRHRAQSVTSVSRETSTTTIQAGTCGIRAIPVSMISAVITTSLSAIGSRNFPSVLTEL